VGGREKRRGKKTGNETSGRESAYVTSDLDLEKDGSAEQLQNLVLLVQVLYARLSIGLTTVPVRLSDGPLMSSESGRIVKVIKCPWPYS